MNTFIREGSDTAVVQFKLIDISMISAHWLILYLGILVFISDRVIRNPQCLTTDSHWPRESLVFKKYRAVTSNTDACSESFNDASLKSKCFLETRHVKTQFW